MQLLQIALIAAAGFGAGFVNAIVGSGSLITFPTLVAMGYPQVTANISNNIGLVSGGFSSIWGYRRELADQTRAGLALVPWSVAGGVAGALLLLHLPERVFAAVVPALIVVALVLVVAQPRIVKALASRAHETGAHPGWARSALRIGVLLAGVYGGYFGAAQGVILVALLGALYDSDLQRANAMKNLLATAVNLVAAVVFVVASPQRVDWAVVAVITVASIVGATTGARFGRGLSAGVLRLVIVAVGVLALARFAVVAL